MLGDAAWLAQPAVLPWLALGFGLCVGSFLNVVIHRLPRMMEREWLSEVPGILEESPSLASSPEAKPLAEQVRALTKAVVDKHVSLARPRSACPGCGRQIRAIENVPLLSYLALRGKCAGCSRAIGLQYPFIEALAGVAAAYVAYRFGFGWKALACCLFIWSTIALAMIDQKTGYLPDAITLPLVWLGLLFNLGAVFVPLHDAVIGAAAGYMFLWSINAGFRALRGMDGMGHGDFKLTAAVGAFLGWKALPVVILLSSIVGVVFGALQMFSAKRGWDWQFKFHFGPYLAIAGIAAMLWTPWLQKQFPGAFLFG